MRNVILVMSFTNAVVHHFEDCEVSEDCDYSTILRQPPHFAAKATQQFRVSPVLLLVGPLLHPTNPTYSSLARNLTRIPTCLTGGLRKATSIKHRVSQCKLPPGSSIITAPCCPPSTSQGGGKGSSRRAEQWKEKPPTQGVEIYSPCSSSFAQAQEPSV